MLDLLQMRLKYHPTAELVQLAENQNQILKADIILENITNKKGSKVNYNLDVKLR